MTEFLGGYFQQIIGNIMRTNKFPMLANLYLANLKRIVKGETEDDPKIVKPVIFKRYMDTDLIKQIHTNTAQELNSWTLLAM